MAQVREQTGDAFGRCREFPLGPAQGLPEGLPEDGAVLVSDGLQVVMDAEHFYLRSSGNEVFSVVGACTPPDGPLARKLKEFISQGHGFALAYGSPQDGYFVAVVQVTDNLVVDEKKRLLFSITSTEQPNQYRNLHDASLAASFEVARRSRFLGERQLAAGGNEGYQSEQQAARLCFADWLMEQNLHPEYEQSLRDGP